MAYWNTSNSSYGNYYKRTSKSPTRTSVSPSKKRNYPKGLQNLTNTCYLSAILQALFLVIDQNEFTINSKSQQEITALFFKLKQTKNTRDYSIFKKTLQQRISIVKGWQQQDAQELLIQLLEQFRKQNSYKLSYGKADLSYNSKQSFQFNWLKYKKQMQKLQNSKIIDKFYGQTLKEYTCPYKHKKYKFERYLQLSLPFSAKTGNSRSYFMEGPLLLKEMIQQYLGEQTIDDLQCELCHDKLRFTKKSILYSTPKILILHLSRFIKGYYNSQKNNREVQYDQILENTQKNNPDKTIKFKLIAVVHHVGTLNRGHYYVQIRQGQDWYQINDERVDQIRMKKNQNISKTAYLLFYQKIS